MERLDSADGIIRQLAMQNLVWGLGFGVSLCELAFRVWGLGLEVWGLEFRRRKGWGGIMYQNTSLPPQVNAQS